MSGERVQLFLSKYWLPAFALLFGAYVALPFLAPVFMQLGWTGPGEAVYTIYSFLCHQLPQRSFFLFGPQASYSLGELQAAGVNTSDLLVLRRFAGAPDMGWKVAWSDRMVSMYTSMVVLAVLWYPLRRYVPRLQWWGFLLFLLPMALDGTSHLVSDLAGLGRGFRDSNAWLAVLTNQAFSPGFYAGDALGSFNSWMRLVTGILFGLGIVWFGFPMLDEAFQAPVRSRRLRAELDRRFVEQLLDEAHHPEKRA